MRLWAAALLMSIALLVQADEPIVIRMMAGQYQGIPPKEAADPRSLARRAVFEEFHRQNPDVRVVNAGGLELTGDRAESGFLMAMAGSTAPDVFYVNFRQYFAYIDQGFCQPLDTLIEADPESKKRISPFIERVLRTYDGKLYAMPFYQVAMALYYRKDHFAQAGLDPNRPPRTWDEMIAYGRKLTEVGPGRNGFVFATGLGGRSYHWSNFVYQAGGEVAYETPSGVWKTAIASPEGERALEMYRRLTVDTWQKDGKTYGPIALLTADRGAAMREGKTSMWFDYTNDVIVSLSDLDPSVLGIAALPAGPAGRRNEINAGMWAINAKVTDPKKLAACWKFIRYFSGDDAARMNTEKFVEMGLGKLVNPSWLRKFGYEDIAAQVDPLFVKANDEVFQTGHPEPYGRGMAQVYAVLDQALDRAKLEPNTPAATILKDVAAEMDQKLLGYTPPDELAKQRQWAAGIVVGLGVALLVAAFFFWRAARPLAATTGDERLTAGADRRRVVRFMAACLAPAGLSVLVWAYYPLARGLMIAFQDYRILQPPQWVGFDNFIAVLTQPVFWRSLLNSFLYVALSLLIGFFLPLFLALALNEIPRAKTFFRTVFYLPAMTSAIVVAFLWRQIYDKSEQGILNSLIAPLIDLYNLAAPHIGLNVAPHAIDWLGNPSLAMFAVVLPGIWAGAGPGSILYLAALKNIPTERYEAADIDGASWRHKIRYITLPSLRPLIMINLLGVFIAGFKAMENVFVLTGGGPLNSTRTVGLEIWENAFMFLKFGYATAAAWMMGAILIGFTLIQIRSLTKVKFTTAKL